MSVEKQRSTLPKKGDSAAQKVVTNYINNVSIGIVNLINILQPDMIVIGGAISKEGDYLLNPIKEYCIRESFKQGKKRTELKLPDSAMMQG